MALLLQNPFLFSNHKTPSISLSHTTKSPAFKKSRKWPVTVRCSAVASPEIGKEDVLVGEEKGRVDVVDYDWTEEWYPLYLAKNVPDDAPMGLTVFDKQVVLFRDGNGEFQCYEDRCPHRLAKLSEGQLIDGRLECLYHGWQFEGDGKCVKIPQANPMKLVSRIKKIQDELPSLKEQCRELLSAKQDLIDKARTTIVGNRASLRKLQTSVGIPITSDSDDPAYTNFNEVIDEWTVQVRSRTGAGDETDEGSEDINRMLFSAIVQGN